MELITLELPELPWEMDVLCSLEKATIDLGVNVWGSTGMFYRPFLNGKYGPNQLGFDKDVCVDKTVDIKIVYQYLALNFPKYRWSVYSGEQKESDYGIKSPHGAVHIGRSISLRHGAVRLIDSIPTVITTPEAYNALSEGVVEISSVAINQRSDTAKFLEATSFRGLKLCDEYPDLCLGEKFIKLIGEVHTPINLTYSDRIYTAHEKSIFPHKTLQDLQEIKEKSESMVLLTQSELLIKQCNADKHPTNYQSWAHFVFCNANDEAFLEWLVNQMRSRNPFGGKSVEVNDALKFISSMKGLPYVDGRSPVKQVVDRFVSLNTSNFTSKEKATARWSLITKSLTTPKTPTWL